MSEELLTNFSSFQANSFAVHLDCFSGPLDLLLHLVRREEVSIEKVNMSNIADQYLQVIHSAKELDLDLAAEFLVVAATLLAIKSQLLLPASQVAEIADEEAEDSSAYEELRERLRRYEQTKRQAQALRNIPQLGVDTFSRLDRSLLRPDPEILELSPDPQSLGVMFVKLLERIGETVRSIRIRLEPISVVDFMMRIINTLQGHTRPLTVVPKTFSGLLSAFRKRSPIKILATHELDGREADIQDRQLIVGTFISMLELIKRGFLSASQSGEMSDIDLSLRLRTNEEINNLELAEEDRQDRQVVGMSIA
ncbi:MAG: segregation/condensation protein A [Deltaproteobacteria bacterium]|nr:segregation/condensation protein A [Deltaproteobacteria bacterium]